MYRAMGQSKRVTEDQISSSCNRSFFILALSINTKECLMNFRHGLIRFRILENHQLHFEKGGGVGNAIKHFI